MNTSRMSLVEAVASISTDRDSPLACDRQLGYQWMMIHANGSSEAEIASAIGRLYRYEWSTSTSGSRDLAQTAADRAFEDQQKRSYYTRFANSLLTYARLGVRPPEEANPFPVTNGLGKRDWRAFVNPYDRRRHPGHFLALTFILSLRPDQIEFLVSDRGVLNVAWNQMTDVQQQMAQEIARAIGNAGVAEWPSAEGALRRVKTFGLFVKAVFDPITAAPITMLVHIGRPGFGFRNLLGKEAYSEAVPAQAKTTRRQPFRRVPSEAHEAPETKGGSYADLEKEPFPADKFPSAVDDSWGQVMKALSRRVSYNLYSDNPPMKLDRLPAGLYQDTTEKATGPAPLSFQGLSLAAGLDQLCLRYGKCWWRRDRDVFFRSQRWFLDRDKTPPKAVLQSLAAGILENNGLDEAGLAALASMSIHQMRGIFEWGKERLGPLPWADRCEGAHMVFGTVAGMPAESRRQFLSGKGLAREDLPPLHQQRFDLTYLLLGFFDMFQDSLPPLHLLQRVSGRGQQRFYEAKIVAAGDKNTELAPLGVLCLPLEWDA